MPRRNRAAARVATLGLLAGSVAGLPSCAAEAPRTVKPEEVASLWKSAEKRLPSYPPPFLWQRRETPPLPLEWPPTAATTWVRHGYAYGFDPRGIADGVRVAAPYARLTLDAAGAVTAVEPAKEEPRELGIQGVKPTNPPSGAIDGDEVRRLELAAVALRGAPAPGSREESSLVSFYGSWLEREGVIAEAVRPAHRGFYDWIEARRAAAGAGAAR